MDTVNCFVNSAEYTNEPYPHEYKRRKRKTTRRENGQPMTYSNLGQRDVEAASRRGKQGAGSKGDNPIKPRL